MTAVEREFRAYWRELNAQLRLLGKRPACEGMARAAHRHMLPADAARVIPWGGKI